MFIIQTSNILLLQFLGTGRVPLAKVALWAKLYGQRRGVGMLPKYLKRSMRVHTRARIFQLVVSLMHIIGFFISTLKLTLLRQIQLINTDLFVQKVYLLYLNIIFYNITYYIT